MTSGPKAAMRQKKTMITRPTVASRWLVTARSRASAAFFDEAGGA